MNTTLFYSSIIIGIVIIAISIYFYSEPLLPLYVITYIGIVTSIMNHGLTSKVAKNLDRIIMLISAIIYIYYGVNMKNEIMQMATLSAVGIMALLYVSSKYIKENVYSESDNKLPTYIHIMVHIISLLLFCGIVINEYWKNKQPHMDNISV